MLYSFYELSFYRICPFSHTFPLCQSRPLRGSADAEGGPQFKI